MSVNKINKVIVDVTRGDCLSDNRKSGSSNTGTYFLCSIKDFNDYEIFFSDVKKYIIDKKKLLVYKELINHFFKKDKNLYPGKMNNFDACCDYIASQKDLEIEGTIRKNDTRVFFRFKDNNLPLVRSFRNLLYEDISCIAFEHNDGITYIYPAIIIDNISIKIDNTDFLDDEEEELL